jgi:hypothetical protein
MRKVHPKKEKNKREAWAKALILSLWAYSKEIWRGRNKFVHEATTTGASKNKTAALQYKV